MKAVQLSPTGAVISIGSVKLDYTALLDPDLERKPVRAGKWLVSPGGKAANQAVAAARAGARVRLIGSIGDDDAGRKLLAFLRDNWIDIEQVRLNQGQPTGSSVVLVTPDGENSILRFPGATALLKPSAIQQMEIREQDIIMTHLGPPQAVVIAALRAARAAGATSILNATTTAHHVPQLLGLASILVVNEEELTWHAEVRRLDLASDAAISAALLSLQQPGQTVVATLGERGAIAATPEGLLSLPGYRVKAVDSTGAGDCFIGNLAAGLASGARIGQSLTAANQAAAISVQRPGAAIAMPYQHETAAAHLTSGVMVQTA